MERDELAALLEAGFSTYRIAKIKGTSQTNVRYWLHRHDLYVERRSHRCTMCGETNPERFYGKKKQICGKCDNQYTLERGRRTAARARAAMGNKCRICGFDTYTVALELHHVDPSTKDPNFNRMRGWSWERVEREMAKCVLLCSNCHAAVHAKLVKLPSSSDPQLRLPLEWD